MLRTAAVRGNFLRQPVKKAIRSTITRAITIESSKRTNLINSHTSLLQTEKHLTWQQRISRKYSSNLPSHTKVKLPALSPTMNMGNIVSWEKKEGDKLQEGDLLAEIETDKATMGFETPEEGYLAKILVPAGTKEVPIGKLVCIIVENAADIAAFKDYKDDGAATPPPPASKPSAPAPTPAAAPPAVTASAPSPPPPAQAGGERVYASPMAKKLAEQRQIRLQGKGTGLFGSITSSDLDKLAGQAPAAAADAPKAKRPSSAVVPSGAAYIDIPLTNMRTVIAKRLLESKTTVPHYYVTVDCNIDKLLAMRQKINKKYEKQGAKVSVNDFIVKAVALASIAHPEVNSAWMTTSIRQFSDVDVSVAVSTPTGLITPIIFKANTKGILTISKEVKILAAKARDGKLQPAEFQGGTISVSNLGMYGVTHFTAIINPPQSAILAIGGSQVRLIPDDSEKGFRKAHFISTTLSSDHRVIDGAKAADWLNVLRDYLEDPELMIF